MVLDEVSIDIPQGEALAVVGESGSGKSMLASSLLDAVDSPGVVTGEIMYHPEEGEPFDILDMNKSELYQFRWEEISMVFQGAMSFFNPTMKMKTHFVETLEAHDYPVQEGLERARTLLSDLHLEHTRVFEAYPHELSGGMKQRVLIALSLVLEPRVLVMDEPTAALDLLMQHSIINLLSKIKEEYGITIVFVTHDLPLITELCDRVAFMYAFEIVEVTEIDDLTEVRHPYSRELLRSIPTLSTPIDQMSSIEGSSPDPVNIPRGCSYHPRCPLASGECREVDPSLDEIGENHQVACHHYEDSKDALPIEFYDPSAESDTVERDGEEVLALTDLEVHFTKNPSLLRFWEDPQIVRAVDGVDLTLQTNDVVAIVGESGCGKTTLSKAAIGLQEPTGGTIEFKGVDMNEGLQKDNQPIAADEIRRSLQIIHQDPGSSFNPNRKIKASLEVPLKEWQPDLNAEDREARIASMLEIVGMAPAEDYMGRYPHQLSGGEKQRVALIRSFLMDPEVILADEAVSALDVSLRVQMMDLMIDLQEQFETSYLFISHDLTNARYLTKRSNGRIAVMYLGEIVEIGPPDQVINDPKHPYTRALKWATADLLPKEREKAPITKVDIPDPTNPPAGCRFHTRCPEARAVCKERSPELDPTEDGDTIHFAACFRNEPEDHPYWQSEELHN